MNECLVTKLRSSVENDSLLEIGEIRFKTINVNEAASTLHIMYSEDSDEKRVRIINGVGLFKSNNQDAISPIKANEPIYIDTTKQGSIISIPNKYGLKQVQSYGQEIEVDLDDLAWSKELELIRISRCTIHGELESISGLTNLLDIRLNGLLNTESTLSGDIGVLRKLTACNKFWFHQQELLEGSIESLVSGLFTNGRRSGSVEIKYQTSQISYHGEKNRGYINGTLRESLWCKFNSTGCVIDTASDSSGVNLATYTASSNSWSYTDN